MACPYTSLMTYQKNKATGSEAVEFGFAGSAAAVAVTGEVEGVLEGELDGAVGDVGMLVEGYIAVV